MSGKIEHVDGGGDWLSYDDDGGGDEDKLRWKNDLVTTMNCFEMKMYHHYCGGWDLWKRSCDDMLYQTDFD